MCVISPILYIDLLKQANYKTVLLLSMIHKQRTYFSKKYSKMNRIMLGGCNKLSDMKKDNVKGVKYVSKKVNIVGRDRFVFWSAKCGNSRVVRYVLNCGYIIFEFFLFLF